jgi:hypothetical protein
MPRPDLPPDPDFWGGRNHNDAGRVPRRNRAPYRRPLVLRFLRLPAERFSPWLRHSVGSWRGAARTGPRQHRTGPRRHRTGTRARPIAAAVLLGALTLAWLGAGHRSRASGSGVGAGASGVQASAPAAVASSTAPGRHECAARSTEPTAATCVDAVYLDVHTYPPGTAGAAYRRATGVAAVRRVGPPTCERGTPDERAWSLPTEPGVAVGRYRCAIVRGRAVMWWTRGDRLAHAVAADADLAALFSWWRAHPAE